MSSVKVMFFSGLSFAALTPCQSSTSTHANMTQNIPVLIFEFTWNLNPAASAYSRSPLTQLTERLADPAVHLEAGRKRRVQPVRLLIVNIGCSFRSHNMANASCPVATLVDSAQ